jgi:hypothetical protein
MIPVLFASVRSIVAVAGRGVPQDIPLRLPVQTGNGKVVDHFHPAI